MKLKNLWFFGIALTIGLASCSDDEKEEAIGITAGTITPAESSVAYRLAPSLEGILDNKDDSIAWDVTDAALQEAVLKVTPTLNATVSYNGVEITSEGVTVDATSPILLQVSNGKKTVAYTLNVYRAKTAAEGLTKKATLSPTNVVWRDFTYFKGKFYAFIVTNKVTDAATGAAQEEYLLKRSVDGIAWTDVDYHITNVEKEVLGGEGARLLVFNDKLYVLLGQRVLGSDKYGNDPKIEDGWFGPSPVILKWRSFVSEDGENFKSLEAESQQLANGEKRAIPISWNTPYANAFVFNGNMYLQGGYTYGFGMQQTSRLLLKSADGVTWESQKPVDQDGASLNLPNDGTAFMLGNKLFLIGGYRNFISASNVNNIIYSTTDAVNWKSEGTLAETMPKLYQCKVVCNGTVAYLFGGEALTAEGTRSVNNKVYRSTDGVNWTEVAAASFVGGRFPSAVNVGDAMWILDGDVTVSTGSYPAPVSTDEYPGNIWNMQMK